MSKAVVLFVVTLAYATRLAVALPNYWYNPLNQPGEELTGVPQCDAQPTEIIIVPGLDSPHGSPILDSSISFAFKDTLTTALSSTLCPGKSYNLTVSFTDRRLALLTADAAISFTSPTPTPGCPNRVDLGRSTTFRASISFTATFNVPCSAAGQTLRFAVTSSPTQSDVKPWYQNSVSTAVSDGAACGTCVPPSPPPSPPLPPPPPSPPLSPPSPPLALSPPSRSPTVSPSPPPPAPPLRSPPNAASPPPPRPPSPVRSPPPPVNMSSECAPSSLGYQCMTVKGKVTVHWSVNTSSAPANLCTPERRTAASATTLAKYGTLHMAVQANAVGYVGIGFLGRSLLHMYPADIVFGYAKSSTPYVNTFFADEDDLSLNNVYPPAGTPSWGYDMGVAQTSSGGVVANTICFSRRLADNRTRVSQNLSTNGKLTTFIWAISSVDGFKEHSNVNRGGFYLDLGIAGKAPAAPPPRPKSPSPSRKSPPPHRHSSPPPSRRSPPPGRRSPPPSRRSPPPRRSPPSPARRPPPQKRA